MEDLHIIKEKMLELMRSLSYSDGVIRGTRIVIDRYIDYVHLNNLSVNIDTVLSFSDLYPKLSSRCRGESYSKKKAKTASLKFLRFYETGDLNSNWIPSVHKLTGLFSSTLEEFLDNERKRIKPATFSQYRYIIYDFNEFLKINKVTEIRSDAIIDYFLDFARKNTHPHPFYNRTIILKRLLKFLFEKGYTSENLLSSVPKAKYLRPKELPSVYTSEEIRKIIGTIDRNSNIGRRDYAMISLALYLGLRAKDIVELKFENIDWENNTINLVLSKTGKEMTLPLLPEVGNAILDYLQNSRRNCNLKFIFITDKGKIKGIGTARIFKALKNAINLSGIDKKGRKYGPHSFRHSLATRMLKDGEPLPVISEVLGHNDTKVTTVYTSIDFDSLRDCALEVPPLTSKFYSGGENHAS